MAGTKVVNVDGRTYEVQVRRDGTCKDDTVIRDVVITKVGDGISATVKFDATDVTEGRVVWDLRIES